MCFQLCHLSTKFCFSTASTNDNTDTIQADVLSMCYLPHRYIIWIWTQKQLNIVTFPLKNVKRKKKNPKHKVNVFHAASRSWPLSSSPLSYWLPVFLCYKSLAVPVEPVDAFRGLYKLTEATLQGLLAISAAAVLSSVAYVASLGLPTCFIVQLTDLTFVSLHSVTVPRGSL